MTESEKMKSGRLFNPSDKSFLLPLIKSEYLQMKFNRTPLWFQGKRDRIAKRLFGSLDGRPYNIFSPLKAVFGSNIHIGKNVFINCNCYFQDYADIIIGDNVMIGPNVSITTVRHPLLAEENCIRQIPNSIVHGSRGNYEQAFSVIIEDNVLIYSGVIVFPGVRIGKGSIIGAGSIVTKDIPSGVLAFGAPCKVIRQISEEDRLMNLP